jgi:hypothetical protein
MRGEKASHSGGRRIYNALGDLDENNFYIAYFAPFGRTKKEKSSRDFDRMGIVAYLEYRLLGRFYRIHGATPSCNSFRRGERRS